MVVSSFRRQRNMRSSFCVLKSRYCYLAVQTLQNTICLNGLVIPCFTNFLASLSRITKADFHTIAQCFTVSVNSVCSTFAIEELIPTLRNEKKYELLNSALFFLRGAHFSRMVGRSKDAFRYVDRFQLFFSCLCTQDLSSNDLAH